MSEQAQRDTSASRSAFGRPGSASWAYRRAALEALRAIDFEARTRGDEAEAVDVRCIVERSFGITKQSLPKWTFQEDGPACYCPNGLRHLAYGEVCEGVRVGLRWLREKGLAVSQSNDADRRNFWRITAAGRNLAAEMFSGLEVLDVA